MDIKKTAIIRFIVAAIATLNAILTAKGMSPLPFNETLVTEWLSYAFDGIMVAWVWWKNSPITKEAITAHDVFNALKTQGIAEAKKLLEEREVR